MKISLQPNTNCQLISHICSVNSIKQISNIWKRLAIVLLLASAIQIVNNALCYHTHIVDGKAYTHAHPGDQEKDHSDYELAFYAQLQLLNSYEVPELLTDVVLIFSRKIELKNEQLIVSIADGTIQGRAPPVA